MSSPLAQPIHFERSGLTAPNAFLKSGAYSFSCRLECRRADRRASAAMSERLCTWSNEDFDQRGKPTPAYIKLYEEWGKGDIGVIVLGNVPVNRTAPEAEHNAVIDKANVTALSGDHFAHSAKPLLTISRTEQGSLVIAQLTHAGRQTGETVNKEPVSSGDVLCPPMLGQTFRRPRPMTLQEIDELVEAFGHAAEVLHKAGADGAQLHAAHGRSFLPISPRYLLSQFLSGRVNNRTDDYGGSLENRSRVVFRIIAEIQKRVPKSFLLSIKINSADFADGGLTFDECKILCQRLDEAGLDLIELSGGTYESLAWEHKSESTKAREAYFVEWSAQLRPVLKTAKLCCTGGFRTKRAMEQALTDGATQLIGLARPTTADPYFCKKILDDTLGGGQELSHSMFAQVVGSVAQIHAIANGQPIPDLSKPETMDAIMASLAKGKEQK
ncbi:SPOSA6832_00450 [Sporobolomyces salmonicolor]|uniref:SPOSA6832_00450-mRNA-1:cds n=1 Tax=Sporidiobolus salmonicolor TaxID=5005 RepID=A0A0D6EGP9_SPOSA|nr:SPOSA6832_00450 [Sporobolomyces salmonicolor]